LKRPDNSRLRGTCPVRGYTTQISKDKCDKHV
jgi:hypothetical protein